MMGLENFFPSGFDFYHLGKVETDPSTPADAQVSELLSATTVAVGFRLEGDLRALLIVLFDTSLDVSLYCEVGNIIASRLTHSLTLGQSQDIILSPPWILTPAQRQALPWSDQPLARKTYIHKTEGKTIRIQTLLFSQGGQTAHA